MRIDLSGRKALVTGGSRGIGRGICTALAGCGADVAINFRSDRASAEKLAKELESMGRKTVLVQGDVSVPSDIRRVIDQTIKAFEKFDILVNNAGIGDVPDEPEYDGSAWDRIMNVHVRALSLFMRHAIDHMKASGWGRIINITSLGALIFVRNNYCLSKRFADELTLAWAQDAARHKITINAIAPGSIKIDMLMQSFPSPEDEIARRLKGIPLQRMATPEEIGRIACFLSSDYADFIVGTIINASGGEIVGK